VEEAAQLLPGYEVLSLIGCGGMGAVYLALQTALDRPVAVKLLPLEVSADEEFAQRFVQEARAMARLSHPHITPVYDFGKTAEGHLYYVMEFVDGANLQSLIGCGLSPERALTIAGQICEALECAHGQGIVHRDIKPANVLVDKNGRVKVTDFGIARLAAADLGGFTLTRTGRTLGTPDYAAPEQVKGTAVDHRADIYSVGVMLYEMLCGEVPRGVFPPPSQRAKCGTRVDALVLKAMQQAPEKRFQTTQELKAAMQPLLRQPQRNARRWRTGVAGMAGLIAVIAAVLLLLPDKGTPPSSPVTPSVPAATAGGAAKPPPTRREMAEWFFRAGDSLSYLGLKMPDGNVLKVESLAQLPEEEWPIVDVWLDRLKSSQQDPPVMPEDFVRHMAGLTELRSAYFRWHALLRDEHYAFLAANPRLEYLKLEGCQVTDAVLEHIAGLAELRTFSVTSSPEFSGRGLEQFACKAVLENLEVYQTGFTHAAVQALRGFPKLRTAGLGFTPLTDACLPALREHPGLEMLYIDHTGVTDAGAASLASMKRLKSLVLDGVQESTLKALREALPGCKVGPPE